jgi:CO/xanthine dehydrogenase FAD-binding subunit
MPAPPPGAAGSAYIRLDYRLAMEIAVVGAAALLVLDAAGRVAHARVALTAVSPVCVLASAAGQRLQGTEPDGRAIAEAAEAAADVARPIGDVRAPAYYRAAMVPVVVRRALAPAVHRARGGAVPVPATLAMAVR